jgi:hypothetical protein
MALALRAQAALKAEAAAREDRHRQAWEAAREARQRWRQEMLTAELTAAELSVSTRTLRRWTQSGRLPVIRLGDFDQSPIRYRRADVEALKAAMRQSPPTPRGRRQEVAAFGSSDSHREHNGNPQQRGGRQHGR